MYSDSELKEFRELINNKLAIAKEELALLQEEISNSGNGVDDTNNDDD